MWKVTGIMGLMLVPIVAGAQTSAGETSCGQSVTELADRLSINLDQEAPPSAAAPVTPNHLAQTDGVVSAPDTGTHDIIHPPATGDSMATAPAMTPQSGSGSTSTLTEADGAMRLQLRSLLTAARAASKRGNEAQCRTSLESATKIAANQK